MTDSPSPFPVFAAKFAFAAVAIALVAVGTLANNNALAADEARAAVGREWVRNVPVVGLNLSFN